VIIILDGPLIPWKAHGGYGKRSFNPLYKEREMIRWKIKEQNPDGVEWIEGPVKISYDFYFAIPKSFSKKKRLQIGHSLLRPTARPDLTNLVKFYEDCIKEFIFEDDSQVVEFSCRKFYGEKPKAIIKVERVQTENL